MHLKLAAAAALGLALAACSPKAEAPAAAPAAPAAEAAPAAPAAPTVTATLTAPTAEVKAGQPFEIAFTGPNGPDDYIDVVAPGLTTIGDEKTYVKTSAGNPAKLTAPADPGAYDVRYVQDHGDRTIIGRLSITVVK